MKKILVVIILIVVAVVGFTAVDSYKGKLIVENSEIVEVVEKTTNEEDIKEVVKEEVVEVEKVTTEQVEVVTEEEEGGITVAELAQHANAEDCWIVYKGSVYDVTSFLPIHPGGVERIAQFCGVVTGFEDAFHGQHGTGKVQKLKTQAGKLQGDLQ